MHVLYTQKKRRKTEGLREMAQGTTLNTNSKEQEKMWFIGVFWAKGSNQRYSCYVDLLAILHLYGFVKIW